MPGGTLKGVQFLHAPAYVLVVGLINQENINIRMNDTGGEMDPHGADEVRKVLHFVQRTFHLQHE